jgi:hypothetical protein
VKTDELDNEAVLSADFASHVIERVRQAKQRRRFRRWVLTCAAAGTVVLVVMSLTAHISAPRLAPIARYQSDLSSGSSSLGFAESSDFSMNAASEPVAFFFPAATTIGEFQSLEATYWHSYDPWWNPNP